MQQTSPFHLAIPVNDLTAAEAFYGDLLRCSKGRSSDHWIDWNLFGHQLVTHLQPGYQGHLHFNGVDSHDVPIPHFGVVLPMEEWEKLAGRLTDAGITFLIEPYIRFKGLPGEQATLFFLDPSGNALEFKAFGNLDMLFATE